MRLRIFATIAGLCAAPCFTAQAQPVTQSYPVVQGAAYKFEQIADGVYYASVTRPGLGSNNVVIINETDVLIVDTGTSPAAARAFVEDIKKLTDKPIRYVVNTHWHYDHTAGNQIFGPEVQIIATDYLYQMLATVDVLHREPFLTSQVTTLSTRIDNLNRQIAAEGNAQQKAALQKDLADAQRLQQQNSEIKVTPPNVHYSKKIVLHRGSREIDLMFLGRGHTGGDTVVYLPKERIVCTGDLMESRLAYMGDAFFDEWITTLEELKKLDFMVDLPGHGVPFTNKGLITAYQAYLADLINQVTKFKNEGVSPEDAAKRVDLTAHAKDFPQITGPGADIRGVRRMYAWLDEQQAAK
ncbi:MAG TPA: MBL fold metallo-hydrolase [Xanthobacteraceae bacterium]|jgi:glyoxylase-like metal-dependent hydrolase (beta-lactamase superfamily II)|nr:MBL fold metallo-hydrolase [Xanthobacteraceae bacterium]